MSNIFYLKENDTRPVLQVSLKNPDGSAHDLTGWTSLKLFVKLNNGTVLTFTMAPVGDLDQGVVKYAWVDADWEEGKLIVGPVAPLTSDEVDHVMEYEVVTSTTRTTFPNDGYDILRITPDLA